MSLAVHQLQFIYPKTRQNWFLFERYDLNHVNSCCECRNALVFLQRISWSTVSKAFFKSMKTEPRYCPVSRPLCHSSVFFNKQETVEQSSLEPDWPL